MLGSGGGSGRGKTRCGLGRTAWFGVWLGASGCKGEEGNPVVGEAWYKTIVSVKQDFQSDFFFFF